MLEKYEVCGCFARFFVVVLDWKRACPFILSSLGLEIRIGLMVSVPSVGG